MKAVILYDSYFGNTEKIAQTVAGVLAKKCEVRVVRADAFQTDQLSGVDLLVLGSPTRAFSPSEATKAFLKTLKRGSLNGVKAAAFDTRVDVQKIDNKFLKFMAKTFGYAYPSMQNSLKKLGAEITAEGKGFYVLESEGPLQDGELEKAAVWAETLL
ncbi:MAG: flavodoxin domain-containing protein [Anaerolineaceae bacterium]|nr:flavodoxin domain-containing protein [Anaerolineaceae bacterium]